MSNNAPVSGYDQSTERTRSDEKPLGLKTIGVTLLWNKKQA
jgi:hypothetical protein